MSTNIQNISHIVRFLERSMKRRTRSSRQLKVLDILMRLPHLSEASADALYHTFVQRRLYGRAAIVAVRYERVEKFVTSRARSSLNLLCSFWDNLLFYLRKRQRWRSIQALISSVHYPLPDLLIWLSKEPLADEEALTVFHMLLSRCGVEHTSLVRYMLRAVITRGLVNQYKLLVNSDNDTVRGVVLRSMTLTRLTGPEGLVWLACDQKSLPGSAGYLDFNGCLSVVCEAGLFTVLHRNETDRIHSTTMALAVTHNKPDLVRFLHSVGAASNSQLFELARYQVQMTPSSLGDGRDPHSFARDAADIQRFLTEAASEPRALQSLCVLEVSKHLGWGHGREARVDSLELSSGLKDKLKFKYNGLLLKDDSDES